MAENLRVYDAPEGIPLNTDFDLRISAGDSGWAQIPTYSIDVASINKKSNVFNRHPISVASVDSNGPVVVQARYTRGVVHSVAIRPASAEIAAEIHDNGLVTFTLEQPRDVMVEINGDKWTALHLLVNHIDPCAPTGDSDDILFFGPGVNKGSVPIQDGDIIVPSGKTLYLAGGAFITARVVFRNVSNAAVRGHGFIYQPKDGAILIERSQNIVVDLFCSSDVLVEKCFLRNSDDTVAIYGHRWDYYGDTADITVRDCVLLPDIAHPIMFGAHGNHEGEGETFSRIRVSNIDILDHEENQMWYQGCIAINVADGNMVEDARFEDIRIEKITRGQLVNLRVMQNAQWTYAPGRGIRDVTFRNVHLMNSGSGTINPSQISGYDRERRIEGVRFEGLKVGDEVIRDDMVKPRWYMVTDLVPMFVNEHVSGVTFS